MREHNPLGRLAELEANDTEHDAFAKLFFRSLGEQHIRYCLLNPWDATKEDVLPGDLYVMIHPDDERKWPRVVDALSTRRFLPLRSVRCAHRTWRYDFAWFASATMNCMAVHVILEDVEGGFMPVSGFGQTSPTSRKKQVGRLDYGGHSERKQLRGIDVFRNPEVMRFVIDDALRRIQCWLHPTGLFLAVLGPDGVGKSTIIKQLIEVTRTAFRSNWVAHWRPMSLWRGKHTSAVTDPHGQVAHSTWWSVARIFCHVMDYWFGYWWKIRPMLARSNLVVFDRYFYDLIIDPRRYRYGGPRWLVRALSPLIPKPDLVFVLEAPDEVVLSRKQEVTPQEVQRQRQCYRQLANKMANANLVRTDQEIEQVVRTVSEKLTDLLARRFHQQHSSCALQTTAVAN